MQRKQQPDKIIQRLIQKFVSHPVDVSSTFYDGKLILRGVMMEHEASKLELALSKVAGVLKVENRSTVLTSKSIFQIKRRSDQIENDQPTRTAGIFERLGLAIAAIFVTAYSKKMRNPLLLLFGLGGLARAVTNIETTRLISILLQPRLKVHRSIQVDAPIENVFEFWKRFENYPKFMSKVLRVSVNTNNGISWEYNGPAGSTLFLNTEIYRLIPNQQMGWRTARKSLIQHTGEVFLRENKSGVTIIDVILTFSIPGGLLASSIAHILGFDPRRTIDSDLILMKTIIENEFISSDPHSNVHVAHTADDTDFAERKSSTGYGRR